MNHKVLLADDSLTIQKVIKITLANQPYDIVDCSSDDELFNKLSSTHPKIVFLDFNLSEKHTGYELTAKIKSIVPSTKVLLLLGTFDSVDEAAMEKCGASDKVVKPFDSNKFIAICKRLAESDEPVIEEVSFPTAHEKTDKFVLPAEEDHWEMSNTPVEQTRTIQEEATAIFNPINHLNPLDQVISDWGMSVPGIINGDNTGTLPEFPPIIAEVTSLKEQREKAEIKFPSNDDLDFPTVEELEEKKSKPSSTSSKLIPLETLNQPIEFEIEHAINSMEDTDVSKIEEQIRDEVEDNLWKVDEFEDLKKEVASKIEEVKNNFQPTLNDFDESLFKPLDDDTIQWNVNEVKSATPAEKLAPNGLSEANLEDLRAEMEAMIEKQVRHYMDEMFKKNVEKVAWEVIPDLAENLIRQELSKISHKLLGESN